MQSWIMYLVLITIAVAAFDSGYLTFAKDIKNRCHFRAGICFLFFSLSWAGIFWGLLHWVIESEYPFLIHDYIYHLSSGAITLLPLVVSILYFNLHLRGIV